MNPIFRINCKLCPFHILYPERQVVVDHLLTRHRDKVDRLKLYSCVEFLCRVCNWREDTVQATQMSSLLIFFYIKFPL